MNVDWKDSLKNLRETLSDDNSDMEAQESDTEKDNLNIQKTPLNVITDRKGRNGKVATIIEGFTIDPIFINDIARQIKQKLGVGGSVRANEILIQGDFKEAVKSYLKNLNYKVK